MSPGLAGWVVKENPWGLGGGGEASARRRRSSFGPHPHLPFFLWAPLTTPQPLFPPQDLLGEPLVPPSQGNLGSATSWASSVR